MFVLNPFTIYSDWRPLAAITFEAVDKSILEEGSKVIAYEAQMRQLARQLISKHGDLAEVRCVSKRNPGHIDLVFLDGEEIVVGEHSGSVDISMMKFGYHGSGSRFCASALC
jgi:hypothetical protein